MNEEDNSEIVSPNEEDIYIEINKPNLCIICLEILDTDIKDACNNCNIKCHIKCLRKWYKSNRKQICPICLKTKNFYRNKKIQQLLEENMNEEERHINSINITNNEIDNDEINDNDIEDDDIDDDDIDDDDDEIDVENNDIIQAYEERNDVEQLIINRGLLYNVRFRNLYNRVCSSKNVSVYLILGIVGFYIYSSLN